ncbi:MAG: hypothetical protein NT154_22940 [Verrucomicrobia bacterium]|nr:hypothetical protein [Verrucomicrobiota bacterium]
MATAPLQEIENQFAQLPRETQWTVIERLVHRLRCTEAPLSRGTWEAGLAAMAADPEVRHELEQIEKEFAPTEVDGLGRA